MGRTVFALGWDSKSVILKVIDYGAAGDQSYDSAVQTYRLPKASHAYDHLWTTEVRTPRFYPPTPHPVLPGVVPRVRMIPCSSTCSGPAFERSSQSGRWLVWVVHISWLVVMSSRYLHRRCAARSSQVPYRHARLIL
jgi:hypothetical protein